MGRGSGKLAFHAAWASGNFSYLIPEETTDLTQLVDEIRNSASNRSKIIVVAEGDDAGGALNIRNQISPFLEDFELRHTVLGHLQRGGSPSFKDRWVASEMGSMAIDFMLKGEFNIMLSSVNDMIHSCSLSLVIDTKRDGNTVLL